MRSPQCPVARIVGSVITCHFRSERKRILRRAFLSCLLSCVLTIDLLLWCTDPHSIIVCAASEIVCERSVIIEGALIECLSTIKRSFRKYREWMSSYPLSFSSHPSFECGAHSLHAEDNMHLPFLDHTITTQQHASPLEDKHCYRQQSVLANQDFACGQRFTVSINRPLHEKI